MGDVSDGRRLCWMSVVLEHIGAVKRWTNQCSWLPRNVVVCTLDGLMSHLGVRFW